MITIPIELLEQVERGNVLLFIGERILCDAAGHVAFDELAAQLANRAAMAEIEGLTFPQIAQEYEDEKGRQGLVQVVKDYFEGLGNTPQAVHRLIAQLADCTILVTTCFDGRLEQAFEQARRRLHPIIGNVDVAFEEEQQTQLYKLRGSLERVESLVLTEDDYETFFEDQASISVVLQGYLARKTILFVGYDLSDAHFKRLYRKVTAPLDNFARRAYAFGSTQPRHTSRWAKRRQIELIEADVSTFLESLTKQLAARKATAPVAASAIPSAARESASEPLPERPYKFLDYYEAKDAGIFFGRRQEIQRLSSLIHAHRLVLLFGASGVGKTSLLLAGAVPRLKAADPPYSAIYVRALEDPAVVIQRILRRALPDANLPDNESLIDFLAAATDALGQTLVIILDQFEEFFIRLSPPTRAAFISQLGAIVEAREVPVKLVFSLREDWLAAMSQIERRIPELLRNRMRLLPLAREQAHLAITTPVERLDLSYEAGLIEQLLTDLVGHEGTTVMPPQLQLVCSTLYDKRRGDDRVITVGLYKRLGRVAGVLQKYLDDELKTFNASDRRLVRRILEELVTSQGTKAVKSRDELAQALDVKLRELIPVLGRLVSARLLRSLEQETGERAYELAHEYLIRKINLTADTQARKQAEELIQQEVENWQRFGTIFAADKLALINEVRDVLRLNDEAQVFILQSALQAGYEIPYWLNRVSNSARRVELLVEASDNKQFIVRQRAVEMLGRQDTPQSVEPLVTRAIRDPESSVRIAARQSLAQLTSQRRTTITRLQTEIENGNSTQRRRALKALTLLPRQGFPLALRVEILMTRLRLNFAWLLNISIATSTRRALLMTGVGLALAVTFSANSYHLDTKSSRISEEADTIVIREGHPWLQLPGFDNEIINTGVSTEYLKDEQEEELKGFRGLWMWQSPDNYRKWGQYMTKALKFEDSVQILWYLGQPQKAVRAIVEAEGEEGLELRRKWLPMLAEVGAANPDVATQIIGPLVKLLDDSDKHVRDKGLQDKPELAPPSLLQGAPEWDVRNRATQAVGELVQADPELATQQLIKPLLELLTSPKSYVRDSAAQALGQLVQANRTLATQQLIERLNQLQHDVNYSVSAGVAQAVGQLVRTNSELATKQLIEPLFELLADPKLYVRENAAQAMGELVQANPELAPELIERLLALLHDPKSYVRDSAAQAMRELVQANPELAPELIKPLLALLDDPKSYVCDSAAQAIGELVQAKPQLATRQVMNSLLTLLNHSESDVRDSAAKAVGQLVEANRTLATPQVIELLDDLDSASPQPVGSSDKNPHKYNNEIYIKNIIHQDKSSYTLSRQVLGPLLKANPELATRQRIERLLQLLDDPESEVRASAIQTLGQLVQAKSELATQQLIYSLFELLDNSESYVHESAVEAVEQVLIANPKLATLQLIERLLALLDEPNLDVRANAAFAVGLVVDTNPQLATQLIERLLALLDEPDSNVRANAAFAVGQVVDTNPQLAPELIEPLLALLAHPESYVRRSAVEAVAKMAHAELELAVVEPPLRQLLQHSEPELRESAQDALARVYAYQALQQEEMIDRLFEQLTHKYNALQRPVAARALFLIALHDDSPSRQQATAIRTRLQTLSRSFEPMERIWANITLQMLYLADKAHIAAKDTDQREEINRQLHRRMSNSELNFFGEEFTSAAQEAVDWLEEEINEEAGEDNTRP